MAYLGTPKPVPQSHNHFPPTHTALPWAWYTNPTAYFNGSHWADSSANKQAAARVTRGAPLPRNRTLKFTPADTLVFPTGSLDAKFTVFVSARYTPAGTQRQIFSVTEQAGTWWLGWNNASEATAYFGLGSPSAAGASAPSALFSVVAGRNALVGNISLFVDGVARQNSSGGTGNLTLAVNPSALTASDCEVQDVLIFREWLVDQDILLWTSMIDVDDCATSPCAVNSTCVDRAAPQRGYDCVCKTGWAGNSSQTGLTCLGELRGQQ